MKTTPPRAEAILKSAKMDLVIVITVNREATSCEFAATSDVDVTSIPSNLRSIADNLHTVLIERGYPMTEPDETDTEPVESNV